MDPFTLRDGDLLLSVPSPADVDRIAELCQDPDIQRWTTVPSPYSRADAEGFVEHVAIRGWANSNPIWGVRLGDRLVGMVGLGGDNGGAEIGYWLGPEARGAGVMHRAVGLAVEAGFERLGLEVVEWRADVGNWASWRVVWRLGFRKEGQVRRLGVNSGRRVDQWIGTLLPDDPREPATAWDGP